MVSWGIKAAYFNMIAAGLLYLFVVLQGVWLILSQQVTASISLITEAGLYAAFGPGMLIFVGVALGFTYSATESLWTKKITKLGSTRHSHHTVRPSSNSMYHPRRMNY
jgi:hypothetical protein